MNAQDTIHQRQIGLGQDLNNAWLLVAHGASMKQQQGIPVDIETEFEIAFRMVRLLSEKTRAEERNKWYK